MSHVFHANERYGRFMVNQESDVPCSLDMPFITHPTDDCNVISFEGLSYGISFQASTDSTIRAFPNEQSPRQEGKETKMNETRGMDPDTYDYLVRLRLRENTTCNRP